MSLQHNTAVVGIIRQASFIILPVLMVCLFLYFKNSSLIGNEILYSIMSIASALLACLAGFSLLVISRFKNDPVILLVGIGLLGASLFEGYDLFLMLKDLSSQRASEISWDWTASRFCFALFSTLSWLVLHFGILDKKHHLLSNKNIYIVSVLIILIIFMVFNFTSLSQVYSSQDLFDEPEIIIPALLFLIAFFGFIEKGDWKGNASDYYFALALMIGFLSEVIFMPFVSGIFNHNFIIAHSFKIIAYIFVFISFFYYIKNVFIITKENKKYSNVILATVADGIITTNKKGILLAFNQAAELIFGYRSSDVIGKNIKMLMPTDFAKNHDGHMKNYRNKSDVSYIGQRRELYGLRQDGSVFPMDLTIKDNVDSKGNILITGVVRDITDVRKSSERLEHYVKKLKISNDELEQFAYIASHDLKAPLRGINNLADFIMEDMNEKIDKNTQRNFALMKSRIQRMEKLLSDLLQYSRAGRDKYSVSLIKINFFLATIIELLAPPDRFEITVSCDADDFYTAEAPLLQVLLNIIGNGIKHHDKKEGIIKIDVTEDTDFIKFLITDDGPGIPKKFHKKIFKMFQTLKPRDEVEGSGMGLAVVEKTISLLGGSITIHTNEDQRGTSFTILWPKNIKNLDS